jgi:hypothetical protein
MSKPALTEKTVIIIPINTLPPDFNIWCKGVNAIEDAQLFIQQLFSKISDIKTKAILSDEMVLILTLKVCFFTTKLIKYFF